MTHRPILSFLLLTILTSALAMAQPALFANGHLSVQPGQTLNWQYYSPGIYSALGDTIETTTGFGGGVSFGYMSKSWWGLYMNLDWVFQSDKHTPKESYPANTFDFDLGARFHLMKESSLRPYLQANYGYSEVAVTFGDPTLYIGPVGSSYSSGVNSWGGSHLALAVGLEFDASQLSDEVSGRWDVHVIVARSSYDEVPTITTYRLNIGYNFWFAL